MLEFAWPWLFLALPLPWLARRFLRPMDSAAGAALRVPFLEDFVSPSKTISGSTRNRWPLWAAAAAWLLLVSAAARPEWLGKAVDLPVSGRDLMLAVDLSGSMRQTDFEIDGEVIDRLSAIKRVAEDFIDRRLGDRIGLILFGERAYLQTPLTFDRSTVKTLLGEATIGLAGDATAIGDAIGLAVKRLRDQHVKDRVLILLTDGANTAGEIEPIRAAELAAREGLRIHTIGIGADEMVIRSLFGAHRVNPSLDLDEKTLKAIAARTGGRYFRARDSADLNKIYALLDEIEPAPQDARRYRPITALYPWPLAAALCLAGLLALSSPRGVVVA